MAKEKITEYRVRLAVGNNYSGKIWIKYRGSQGLERVKLRGASQFMCLSNLLESDIVFFNTTDGTFEAGNDITLNAIT